MKKNILFDMGNVLIRWDPALFVKRLGFEGEDAKTLVREVYGGVTWVQLDRGAVTEEEAAERIRARLPERLRGPVEALVSHWDSEPLQVAGMEELVGELSERGYGLYLLTNAALRHHSYWPRFPVSRFFEGRVMLSADWKLLKPEPAYYEKAFSLFGLDRSECLFIDDNPGNMEAANRLGLDGIVFYGDAGLLRRELRAWGVEVEA